MLLNSVFVVGFFAVAATAATAGRLADHGLVERQRQGGGGGGGGQRQGGGGGQFTMENWTDGTAKVSCRGGNGGAYTVSWSGNKGNFVCGKGYNTGDLNTRNVSYTGTIESAGNAYVSLYGWTRSPLVEWYVVDWYGAHKPCTGGNDTTIKWLGNMTTDGDDYEICTKMRVNKPSIDGTSTFPQFWSIRKTHRTGGTITARAHFDAWTKAGLKLGKQQYMILAVEGQDSNGTASVTVGTAPA